MSASGVLIGHCASLTIVASSVAGHLIGDLQMGVTVFFVISGFLLYRPFVAADMAGRSPAPTSVFYRRRLLRIIPAYWFALTVVALLPGVISVFTSDQWWRYYLLIQNYSGINFVFARGIGPAWSLSVEMAFYLTLPLFAWVMRRTRGGDPDWRLSGDLIVLGAIALIAALVRADLVSEINANHGLVSGWKWTLVLSLPLFLTWFAVGMAFASISSWSAQTGKAPRALRSAASHPGLVWLFALSCYGLMAAVSPALPSAENAVHHTMMGLIAAAIVFPAAFPHPDGKGVPGWFLALPAIAWVGLVSYGLYLWGSPLTLYLAHEGIFSRGAPFLSLAAYSMAAALVAAAFSYYVVERPFLRLKYARRGRRWFRRSDPELRRAA
jgi:peptidoglycan/LPS O-acetylase OafA/YrhL